MDCNRDEAARSKSIAEKKFTQQDYAGAKKFALKARQLFPDLEGLVQFIAVVDVHATAHDKLQCAEKDWYGILQSDPSADEASLRKQYRKLALILHPDKNKSLGAEAAFKYVSEAWSILSDKNKKAAYDSRRQPPKAKPVPSKKTGHAFQTKRAEKPPPRKKQARKTSASGFQPQPSPVDPHVSSSPEITFWTACPDCKLQYEYHVVYKNKKLCCPFCLKAFLAKELAVVTNGSVIWPPLQEQNQVGAVGSDRTSSVNGHSYGPKSPVTASFRHQGTSQVDSEARKENTAIPVPFGPSEQRKTKEVDNRSSNGGGVPKSDPLPMDQNVLEQQINSEEKVLEDGCEVVNNASPMEGSTPCTADTDSAHRRKEGCGVDVLYVNLESGPYVSPSKKGRVDCQVSSQEEGLEEILMESPSKPECKKTDNSLVAPDLEASELDRAMADNHISNTNATRRDCDVAKSGFYVFDNDRTESHFASEQVWACYDDDDRFPRYYARIVKIIAEKPFKLQYTWLEVRSSSEEVMMWLDAGFSYTCGEFKLGKTLTGDSKGMFSHIMTFEKGQNGCFIIYPQKGEVWALYKDWSTLITKDDKHGYELVEVLTEFSVESGTQVCLLVKVDGFNSVFQRQAEIVYKVRPDQMRRFSHNIPAHLLNTEVSDCIEGCLELDPASLPRT